MTLREMVAEAVQIHGRQERAAHAMGITAARISRILHGSDEFSLSVATCLRLARVLARSPSGVLRAAGKNEEAELIESMYGPAQNPILSPDEHALILALRDTQAVEQEIERQDRRSRDRMLRVLSVQDPEARNQALDRLRELERAELRAWAEVRDKATHGSAADHASALRRWEVFDARIESLIADVVGEAPMTGQRS